MGVEITPLGFRKPDGKELVRNMDDEISHNAQRSDDILTEVQGRLSVVDPNADSLVMTDQGMSGVINDTGTQFSGILNSRVDSRVNAAARVVDPAKQGVPVDGVADATVAFQAMLTSLPAGSVVEARLGQRFKITAPLNLTKAVTIRGGEFIANPTGATFSVASNDVTLEWFTITGPGAAAAYTVDQKFITSTGTDAARINRLRISGLKLTGCQSSVMWLEWIQDFLIEQCDIDGFQYAGIMLLSPKRGLVTKNTVRNGVMASPLINAYGIAATDTLNTVAARAEHVTISENYVENIPGWEGIDTHGGLNIKILGNTVRSCRTPIAVTGGNSTRVVAPNGFVISGNYLEKGAATSQTTGIFVDGANSTTLADGAIGHNTIRGFTTDLTLKDYSPDKTSVAAQSTDAATLRSPHHPTYRTWIAVTTISIPSNTAGAVNNITFPAGMFSVIPVVQVTKQSAAGAIFTPYANEITTAGCKVGVYDPNGTGGGATSIPVALTVTQSTPTGNSYPRP